MLEFVFVHLPETAGRVWPHVVAHHFHEELQTLHRPVLAEERCHTSHATAPHTRALFGPLAPAPLLTRWPGAIYIAFLREPLERVIACFERCKRVAPEDERLAQQFHDGTLDLLTFAQHPSLRLRLPSYAEILRGFPLERFNYIGFHETFSADLRRIADALGWTVPKPLLESSTTETPGTRDVSPQVRDELQEILAEELRLYEQAKALMRQRNHEFAAPLDAAPFPQNGGAEAPLVGYPAPACDASTRERNAESGGSPREISPQDADVERLRSELRQANAWLAEAERHVAALKASRAWKLGRFLVGCFNRLRGRPPFSHAAADALDILFAQRRGRAARLGLPAAQQATNPADPHDYQEWVRRYDTLPPATLAKMYARLANFAYRPLISVLLPVCDPVDPPGLDETIRSVKRQVYPYWQLCVADDATATPEVHRVLEEAQAAEPQRVRYTRREARGSVCRVLNDALALAEGEFVALLQPDGMLREHALFAVAAELQRDPAAELLYTDEDERRADGSRVEPFFKPALNLELLRAQNCIGDLGVYRRSRVDSLGGFRAGYEGAHAHDLALRVLDATEPQHVRHIPLVTYHKCTAPGVPATTAPGEPADAREAAQRAVADHLARRGEQGVGVEVSPSGSGLRLRYPVPEPAPPVSLVIPTRDRLDLLRPCLEGLLRHTDYADYEIVVVDHGSRKRATKRYLAALTARERRVKVVRHDGPFNFPELTNVGVGACHGSILGLLNNDLELEPEHAGWLREMVSHAVRPDVGAVGAKLLYPDRRIQHAGIILGIHGAAGHHFKHLPAETAAHRGRAQQAQDLTAVTGACLLLRRDVYEHVGGLDPALAVAYNDVDLCLRIRHAGYRILYTPHAQLTHHESATRGPRPRTDAEERRHQTERAYFTARWQAQLAQDPAYNPNLTVQAEDAALAWPPEVATLSAYGDRQGNNRVRGDLEG